MTDKNKLSRRKFLTAMVSVATGTASTALLASTTVSTDETIVQSVQKKQKESKGYHHTEHVDTYYQIASF